MKEKQVRWYLLPGSSEAKRLHDCTVRPTKHCQPRDKQTMISPMKQNNCQMYTSLPMSALNVRLKLQQVQQFSVCVSLYYHSELSETSIKNIRWWWSQCGISIEKTSMAMVPWKKHHHSIVWRKKPSNTSNMEVLWKYITVLMLQLFPHAEVRSSHVYSLGPDTHIMKT